jgi:hypothetical protein
MISLSSLVLATRLNARPMERMGSAIPQPRDREGSGRAERERARYNVAGAGLQLPHEAIKELNHAALLRWLGANFTAGRGRAWEGGRGPKLGIRRGGNPADGLHWSPGAATERREDRESISAIQESGHIIDALSGSQARTLRREAASFLRFGPGNHAALRQTESREQNRCTSGSVSRRLGFGENPARA